MRSNRYSDQFTATHGRLLAKKFAKTESWVLTNFLFNSTTEVKTKYS